MQKKALTRTPKLVVTPKKGGFTLIELLVVISIIGMLSSIVLASLNSARAKARDSKRVSEINQLGKALAFYYDKHGTYPQVSAGGFTWARSSCATPGGANSEYYSQLQKIVDDGFLPSIPKDPINKAGNPQLCYWYFTYGQDVNNCGSTINANAYEYVIYFSTENMTLNLPVGRPNTGGPKYCLRGPTK